MAGGITGSFFLEREFWDFNLRFWYSKKYLMLSLEDSFLPYPSIPKKANDVLKVDNLQ